MVGMWVFGLLMGASTALPVLTHSRRFFQSAQDEKMVQSHIFRPSFPHPFGPGVKPSSAHRHRAQTQLR